MFIEETKACCRARYLTTTIANPRHRHREHARCKAQAQREDRQTRNNHYHRTRACPATSKPGSLPHRKHHQEPPPTARNSSTPPAIPDGAFKKGNDVESLPPPMQGLGFSPR